MNFASGDDRRRRAFFEIIYQILGTCHDYTKKTVLMYSCNLSFKQLTGYLDLMLNANLLETENDGTHSLFRTSSKGKDFLKAYEVLMAMLDETSAPLVTAR